MAASAAEACPSRTQAHSSSLTHSLILTWTLFEICVHSCPDFCGTEFKLVSVVQERLAVFFD